MTREQKRILEAGWEQIPATMQRSCRMLVNHAWYAPKLTLFSEALAASIDQAQTEIDRYKKALEQIRTRCTSVASCVKVAEEALNHE